MMTDSKLFFGTALSCIQTFGTGVLLGDVVDIDAEDQFPFNGQSLSVVVNCDTRIIHAGAESTCEFYIVTAENAALTTNAVIRARSGLIAVDDATALDVLVAADDYRALENKIGGRLWNAELPPAKFHRYFGLFFIANSVTPTAGAVTAFLTQDPSAWRPFAAAV